MINVIRFQRVALIGFGEAGSILGEDLTKAGCAVATYDLLLSSPTARAAMIARAGRANVVAADSLRAAIEAADLIISAVTASSARDVARDVAAGVQAGQYFLDINSVSPATKRENAEDINSAGAYYVEAAVMAPVPPQRLKVPMLLGGARAASVAEALRGLGMNTTAISEEIGVASAVKMCRSILIKGLEALTVESMLAARRFGAEEQVLASLQHTFPSMGWDGKLPDYLVSRVAEHGRRRAAEVREVARTLRDVGLDPVMAEAIALRQDMLVDAMKAANIPYSADQPFEWRALADRLHQQD